jgi:aspartate-semialdehyde dehydrogenase
MDLPNIEVTMTCVRVPVSVGHSATMLVETERPLSPEDARAALAAFPGVELIDDPSQNRLPTPADVAGRDEVLVGRVRRDLASNRSGLYCTLESQAPVQERQPRQERLCTSRFSMKWRTRSQPSR